MPGARLARQRHLRLASFLAIAAVCWILALFLMHVALQGPIGDNASTMLQSESDRHQIQSPGAALEVGSLQQAGALQLAVMELEGKMDSLGKKILAAERSRLNSAMRREMEAEALKTKSKSTGEVKKLSKKRILEPFEIEGFIRRRDAEIKRLAQLIAQENCTSVDECTSSTDNKLDATISGEETSPTFAAVSSLSYSNEAEGRRVFGSNLENISDLKDWLPPDISRFRYKTCAVVGNSAILKNQNHGAVIDEHSAVFRVNQAPTAGYEKDVGGKATLRVLNSVWGKSYINHVQSGRLLANLEENVALVASRMTPSNFVSLSRKLDATRKDVHALLLANAIVVDARMALDLFRLQAQRKALMKSTLDVSESSKMSGAGYKGGQAPSTGLLAVMLALRLCGSVSVYGFSHEISRDASTSSYRYHYFSNFIDSAELRAHPHHSFKLEGDMLESFHRRHILDLCEMTSVCSGAFDHAPSSPGNQRPQTSGVQRPETYEEVPKTQKSLEDKTAAASRGSAISSKSRIAEGQLRGNLVVSKPADHVQQHLKSKVGSIGPPHDHRAVVEQGKHGNQKKKTSSSKDLTRGLDRTSAKKIAFMHQSNSGRLDNDVPKSENEGTVYEGEGKIVSWEQLSTEQKQAVDLDRIANERLEQVLGAAVGDAAELRQVERNLKKRGGHQKDGKIITLKSGTRFAMPERSAALVKSGEGLEVIPRIIDPMLLADSIDEVENPPVMKLDDAGGHKSRPSLSSDDGKESDQDADIAGEDLFREKAKVDGYSEREQHPEQSEITQASYGSNYTTHDGPLKNVYGDEVVDAADPDLHEMLSRTRGNSDATYAQHGMTPGASRDGTAGMHRISQDVRPDSTPIQNMENVVVVVTYNEEGNPVESLRGVARLADHVNEATATALSENVLSEFPVRKEQGRKNYGTENATMELAHSDYTAIAPPSYSTSRSIEISSEKNNSRKRATPAQQFKQDQRAAARLAKMKLEDIADPEMRAREESWRKMEQDIPSKEVDINCLSRGSSDGCFKSWMNSKDAKVSQQYMQGGVHRVGNGGAAASLAAMQLRQKAHDASRRRREVAVPGR